MTERLTERIGFLGAGRMATALARGWIAAGLIGPDQCQASDPVPAARQSFQAETGCAAGGDNRAVVAASEVLILAVKPQTTPALLAEIGANLTVRPPLLVSIAAGITLRQLAGTLGSAR